MFYLAIGLSIVRWIPNLPYAHKLTKLSDDIAFKVGPSVTEDFGWCSKDQDLTLPQKLGNSFDSFTGCHICHDMFLKMVAKDQKVHHIWGLIQLHCCLNAGKVNMQ